MMKRRNCVMGLGSALKGRTRLLREVVGEGHC